MAHGWESLRSLWRDVDTSVCVAPLDYDGACSAVVDTTNMSEKDKYAFGAHCGARCTALRIYMCSLHERALSGTTCLIVRWPCRASALHLYSSICPEGWMLQVCSQTSVPVNLS